MRASGAALTLCLSACAPSNGSATPLEEAARIGVPSVADAQPRGTSAEIAIVIETGAIVIDGRAWAAALEERPSPDDATPLATIPADVAYTRITDLERQGHVLVAFYDALERLLHAGERLDPSPEVERRLELWIPADTMFMNLVEVVYTAERLGLDRFQGVVRVGDEVAVLPLRPPHLHGPKWPSPCVTAELLVETERVSLHRELWWSDLEPDPIVFPLDAGVHGPAVVDLPAALTAGLRTPLCPNTSVGMQGGLPWSRLASVLSALDGGMAGEPTIELL